MAKRVDYAAYPHFVLRVPGLPLEALDDIPIGKSLPNSFVEQKWKNEVIRAAVGLASYSLSEVIEECQIAGQATDNTIKTSFLNYYTRFCTRPTPFGLFAGVVLGEISKQNSEIYLEDVKKSFLHLRLDTEYLLAYVRQLVRIKEIREQLVYKPASTLYLIGNQLRLIESIYLKSAEKKYRLTAFDNGEVLQAVIEFCKKGESFNNIVAFLSDRGYSDGEAREYIDELVDNQIIVSNLEVVVTGVEYQLYLYNQLKDLRGTHPLLTQLLSIIDQLKSRFSPQQVPEIHPKLLRMVSETAIPVKKGKLLQGDLHRTSKSNRLSESVVNQVLMGVRILKALSNNEHYDSLAEFKTLFRRRFGDREVPLSIVMDQDNGIGLHGPAFQQITDPAPLLDDLAQYGYPGREIVNDTGKAGKPSFNLIERDNSFYYELSRDDIRKLDIHKGDDWPYQLYAMPSLFGSKEQPEIYLPYAVPGHAARLLGRFGFMQGSGIREFINLCIKDEIDHLPDVVMAEIQHLPQDRTGNILQRPAFYEYEIPFMAQSVKDLSKQFHIDDIIVSLPDDIVVLRSKRSGQRILPRLSNAHNYSSGNLELYEFLVEVGKQGQGRVYQVPQPESSGRSLIPGIRYKNIHFRLPEWHLYVQDLRERIKSGEVKTGALALKAWAEENHLPRQTYLIEGDRDYYVDWSNPLFFQMVWNRIRKKDLVRFQLYPYTGGSPVRQKEYSFANQLVICFHQTK